jgi:hypothetical protein
LARLGQNSVHTTTPDTSHSDLFVGVQSVSHHQQAEFLKLELETCLRSANLAANMYRAGDTVSAERTRAVAEECYSDVLQLLSEPKDSNRLTIKTTQEFRMKLKALRKTLDGLDQFRTPEEDPVQGDIKAKVRRAAS